MIDDIVDEDVADIVDDDIRWSRYAILLMQIFARSIPLWGHNMIFLLN